MDSAFLLGRALARRGSGRLGFVLAAAVLVAVEGWGGRGGARAEPELIDRIAAVVGDEIILMSEVEEEVYLARLRGEVELDTPEQVESYRGEVLHNMIEGKILLERAEREGIQVSREEVEHSVEAMIEDVRRRLASEEAFEEELAREGTNLEELKKDYRERVREQLMVRQVVDRYVRSRVDVDEREVREYWEENHEQIPMVPAGLELRRIFVGFHFPGMVDSASARRAEIVRGRLERGEDFATLAKVFSEGPTASRGGDLGWFRLEDLEPILREAVQGLAVGEISPVVLSSRGAHILRLEETREDEFRLRQIVFLHDENAARASARARAEAILTRLHRGESFEELARTLSDDSLTREAGGYLGKVPVEALLPEIREELEKLAPGEISRILRDEGGFSIFRVDGREGEHPPTYEEIHDRIETILEREEAAKIYREFIEKARSETYVENRLEPEK